MKTFQKLIVSQPDFISTEELATAKELQEKIDNFTAQLLRYRAEGRASRLLKAENAYLEDPSEANLNVLESIHLWRLPFVASTSGDDPVSRVIHRAREGVLRDEVLPWAFPIWTRAFNLFREHFLASEKQEAARILEVSGKPMTHSDVLRAYAGELNEWINEGIRAGYVAFPEKRDVSQSDEWPLVTDDPQLQGEVTLDRYRVTRFRQVARDRWLPTGSPTHPYRAVRTPSDWLQLLGIDLPQTGHALNCLIK